MTIPRVIDKREIWLDALSEHAAEVLQNARTREERGLTRTQRERDLTRFMRRLLVSIATSQRTWSIRFRRPF